MNEKINIGGDLEISNLSLVRNILKMMGRNENLIEFVSDRPGHDLRYAIDNTKIYTITDWKPSQHFEQNLQETIEWYQNNPNWWNS